MATMTQRGTLVILLLIGFAPSADAEYLIYLKGGHFIVADDCTYSAPMEERKSSENEGVSILVEQCSRDKKPTVGRIFWSIDDGINETTGEVHKITGEVNADDVFDIIGSKGPLLIKKSGTTMPLEDYLITNRGESFVNAKIVEQKDLKVDGLKRETMAEISQRGGIKIDPERLAKTESGEGLCPKEPPEFAVGEVEIVDSHLLGSVINYSKEPWRPKFEAEVRVKGRFLGKFEIEDSNLLDPGEDITIDSPVPSRFLEDLKRLKDAEAGVRLCYRKVKTATKK